MLIGIIFLKPMWGYLAFDPPNSSSSSVNFISNRLISVWVQPQKFIHTTCTLCVCELLIHQYMCTYMYIVPPCHGLWCHVTHVTFHLSSSTSGPLLDSVGTPATPLLLDLNSYTCMSYTKANINCSFLKIKYPSYVHKLCAVCECIISITCMDMKEL